MRHEAAYLGILMLLSAGMYLPIQGASADTQVFYVGARSDGGVGRPPPIPLADLGTGSCMDPNYASISAAVTVAIPGDVIVVCSGLYDETVTITTSSLTIIGTPGARLRPSNSTMSSSGLGAAMAIIGAHAVIVKGLTIDGTKGMLNYGIYIDNSYGDKIVGNTIASPHNSGIFVTDNTNGVQLAMNKIHDAQIALVIPDVHQVQMGHQILYSNDNDVTVSDSDPGTWFWGSAKTIDYTAYQAGFDPHTPGPERA